jgi:hypothetical protein
MTKDKKTFLFACIIKSCLYLSGKLIDMNKEELRKAKEFIRENGKELTELTRTGIRANWDNIAKLMIGYSNSNPPKVEVTDDEIEEMLKKWIKVTTILTPFNAYLEGLNDMRDKLQPKEQEQRTGIIDKNGKEVLIGSTLRCEWIDENETPQITDYVVQFKFGMACIDITFTGDSGKDFGDFESIYEPVIKLEYYVV